MNPLHPLVSLCLALVVPVAACALEAKVETRNGVPTLLVNGRPTPPMILLHTAGSSASPKVCKVTPQWQEFHFTFVAPQDDDAAAVHIRNAMPAGDWWVDDARFFEGGLDKPASDNLFADSDFEAAELPTGWTYFVNNSTGADVKYTRDTEAPHSGKACLRVHIAKAGTVGYQIHMYRPIKLRKNTTYTFSVWLRASDSRDIEIQAIHQGEPWTIYGGENQASDKIIAFGAERGLHMTTMPMDLPWPQDGKAPDYTATDAQMEHILSLDPQGLVIPRVHLDAPDWWKKAHPGHIMVYDYGPRTQASPASPEWQRDSAEALRLLIRHLEGRYSEHMLGYHFSAQSAGEWFYDWTWEPIMPCFEEPFRQAFAKWAESRYKTIEALQAAWSPGHDLKPTNPIRIVGDTFGGIRVPTLAERKEGKLGAFRDPKTQRYEIDFAEYMQECLCDNVLQCARLVKEETKGKKLTVSFSGYLYDGAGFAYGGAVSGHLRMRKLLDSPDMDILCSPISYNDRGATGTGPFMSAVDSVMAHGKLWLNEDDARTHLAPADADFGRTSTMAETLGVYQRNFGHQFERHCATWFMDFGTGWMADPTIFDMFAKERDIWARESAAGGKTAAATRIAPFSPQVAVITDEDSFLYLRNSSEITTWTVSEMRRQVNTMGCPVGHYLLADLCEGRVPESTRLYVFLNAYRVTDAQRKQIRQHIARDGKVAVWLYAPGFVRDDASAANVSDLIGMNVTQLTAPMSAVVKLPQTPPAPLAKLGGQSFGPDKQPTPMFAVTPGQAGVVGLGSYQGTQECALALKRMTGWTSVFCGGLGVSAEVLRELARMAGVHVYCETGDVISGRDGFTSIHATAAGEKTLIFPKATKLRDLISGETLAAAKTHRFTMQAGDTRLFGWK